MEDIENALRDKLLLALAGDNAAYAGFLTLGSTCLRAYFRRRLVAFPDDVEDLVQETLLALHNRRHTYRPSEPLTPWLYAIARYKLVDALRANLPRRAVEIEIDEAMSGDAFVEAGAGAAEARRDLLQLLATLPDRYRLPIVRVKLEGRSVAETAMQLGLSESAVKVGIHRGLRRLAEQIGRAR